MTITKAIILAVLQGVTEFIPISSSGHLVLMQNILDLREVPLLFDLILHLGTVTATIIIFRMIIAEIFTDLYLLVKSGREDRVKIYERGNIRLIYYIALSTVITAALAYGFKDLLRSFFYKPGNIPYFFIITGLFLFITKFRKEGQKGVRQPGISFPVVVGAAQAVSMLPGISRSGSTISAGLFMGGTREFAGMYSFLLSIPSVFGASLFEFAMSGNRIQGFTGPGIYAVAFAVSFLTGLGALKLLLRFLRKGKLYFFSFYCFAAGIAGILLSNLKNVFN
jgi:undecaprenyl-diphosphatase